MSFTDKKMQYNSSKGFILKLNVFVIFMFLRLIKPH